MKRGRKKIDISTGMRKDAHVGFRYQQSKYEFLVKAYGADLPNKLRECADKLIIEAVNKELR
jgi:hypothetical protein